MPRTISVITPCFRSVPFLGRLHRSLSQQTYRKFEWICVDDCSPDNTVEQLLKLNSPGDLGMQVYRLPQNTYGPVAISIGTQIAKGEIVVWIDHDDEFLPDALARIADEWPVVASRSDLVGAIFPLVDPSGFIPPTSLPEGAEFNLREFEVRFPDISDAVFAFKRQIAQRVASVERMEDVALLAVPIGEMADFGRFLIAKNKPVKIYNRDNPDSQTNNPRISRKTVASYARLLNQADHNYLLQPMRWIKHAATLLRYSKEVHGAWLMRIDLVTRFWPRLALMAAFPLGWLAYYLRSKDRVVEIAPLSPDMLAVDRLIDLRRMAKYGCDPRSSVNSSESTPQSRDGSARLR